MDKAKKMDCRANGEILLGGRKPLQPGFCEMPSSHSVQEQSIGGVPRYRTTMTNIPNQGGQRAAQRFVARWEVRYPKAIAAIPEG